MLIQSMNNFMRSVTGMIQEWWKCGMSYCRPYWIINWIRELVADIRQHENELRYFLIRNQIDVMIVSETHLTYRSYLRIICYTIYDTKDPRGTALGGTTILIKSRKTYLLLNSFSKDYLQTTNVCIIKYH